MMVAASSAAATPCAVVMGRPKAGWLFHANQYTDEISVLLAEPGKHDLLIALLILLCRFHGVAARLVRSGFRGVVTPRLREHHLLPLECLLLLCGSTATARRVTQLNRPTGRR